MLLRSFPASSELIALNDSLYFFQDRWLLVCSMWEICRLELPRRQWRTVFPTHCVR